MKTLKKILMLVIVAALFAACEDPVEIKENTNQYPKNVDQYRDQYGDGAQILFDKGSLKEDDFEEEDEDLPSNDDGIIE